MRFSIFHNFDAIGRWHEYHAVVREVVEIAQLADRAGYWSIWYPEQHFRLEGNEAVPNPVLQGAWSAAHTSRIRIGQAANIITQWHPLRLAEDLAVLDHMTGGRVEVGIGRGFAYEAINLNPHADTRDQEQNRALFEETLDILLKAWTDDSFAHKGRFYQYPVPGVKWDYEMSPPSPRLTDADGYIVELPVMPRPLQQPHPPIWQPITSARSIEWAAQRGINGMMWGPPVVSLREQFELYRAAASRARGKEVPLGQGLAVLRDVYVADTMEQARREAADAITASYGWILGRRGRARLLLPDEELTEDMGLNFDFLFPRNMLVGTAEFVIDRIHELREALNLEHMFLWSSHARLPYKQTMRSLALFAERVMPEFAD